MYINTLDPSTAGNWWDSASYDVTALSGEERLNLESMKMKEGRRKGGKKHQKKKKKEKRANMKMQARKEEGGKEEWLTATISITSTTKGKSSLVLTDVHLYDLATRLPPSLPPSLPSPPSSPSSSSWRVLLLLFALGVGLMLFVSLVHLFVSARGGWRWENLPQWHRMEEEEEEGGEGGTGYIYRSLEMPKRKMEEEEEEGKGGREERRDEEEEVLFQRERGGGRREGGREGGGESSGLPSARQQRKEGYGSTGYQRGEGGREGGRRETWKVDL